MAEQVRVLTVDPVPTAVVVATVSWATFPQRREPPGLSDAPNIPAVDRPR